MTREISQLELVTSLLLCGGAEPELQVEMGQQLVPVLIKMRELQNFCDAMPRVMEDAQ